MAVSSLCFVPFNMVVLVFLCKQGISLPRNSCELYNHFICLTICQYLTKSGFTVKEAAMDLASLPSPCGKLVQRLSNLSLEALKKNELIFTSDEIKHYTAQKYKLYLEA